MHLAQVAHHGSRTVLCHKPVIRCVIAIQLRLPVGLINSQGEGLAKVRLQFPPLQLRHLLLDEIDLCRLSSRNDVGICRSYKESLAIEVFRLGQNRSHMWRKRAQKLGDE